MRNKEKVKQKYKQERKDIRKWYIEYKETLSCEICGYSAKGYPEIIVFHHHNDDKDSEVSRFIHNCQKQRAIEEMAKCQILCQNCHRKVHAMQLTKYRKKRKEWYMALKSTFKCEKCGETDISCLDFHHNTDKDAEICDLYANHCNVELILAELEKCSCLCANCHKKLHKDLNNRTYIAVADGCVG